MALTPFMRAVLLMLVLLATNSMGAYHDCGSGSRLVSFDSFSAYPMPAIPGQYLHLTASFTILEDISSANVTWIVSYQNQTTLLYVSGIQLCNFTTALDCNDLVVSNTPIPISFDWLVPELAYGDYDVTYYIGQPGNFVPNGCITFDVTIGDPSVSQADEFDSYYYAYLVGAANFTNDNMVVQVGPVGVADYAQNNPWGIFSSISGSGDVVHPSFNPTNYIWGLTGNRTNYTVDAVTGETSSVYVGDFFVGYIGPYGTYASLGNFLTQGTFIFNRFVQIDGTVSINGYVQFQPPGGVYPPGWFNPINLARLGNGDLTTDEHGQLVVSQTSALCRSNPTGSCTPAAVVAPGSSRGLGSHEIGGIIGGVIGGVLFLALIAFLIYYLVTRNKRRAEEDRVFRAGPNEYGDALVVDDIIQKSRSHNGAELPMLNPRGMSEYPPGYMDRFPMPGSRDPRRRSRYSTRPASRGAPSLRSSTNQPYDSDDSDRSPERDDRASSRSRSPRRRSTRNESPGRSLSSRSTSPEDRGRNSGSGGSSQSRSRSGSPDSRDRSYDSESDRGRGRR